MIHCKSCMKVQRKMDLNRCMVFLPNKMKCCGCTITIQNRPCFPLVYTSNGTS
jgi:hypothetical protein